MWPKLRYLFLTLWPGLRSLYLIVAWLTFIYIWRHFTHTSTSDWYSLDKRLSMPAAWFVSVQERIVLLRGLGRPIPLPPGSHTGLGELGRQRGLQRALAPYGSISARTHAHARARDSTIGMKVQEWVCVRWVMCLDTTHVSKSTVSVAGCSVSIWRRTGVSAMRTYRWHRRERCR